MEKKNRFASVITLMLAVVFAASSLGCSSSSNDDSATENKYLPNKFSVAIPKGLQKSGASSNMKGAARSLSGRSLETAYTSLTSDVGIIVSVNMNAAILFVLADEAINQNGFTPSSTSHGTVTIILTRDLLDRIKAILGDIGVEGGDIESYLGKSIALQDFIYSTTPTSPYNFIVSFSWSMEGSESDNLKIYWSSDLKKVKYGIITPKGIPEHGVGYLDNEFTYDDDLQATAFVMYQKGSAVSATDVIDTLLKLRADGDGGAYVSDYSRDPPQGYNSVTVIAYGNSSGGILKEPDGSTYTFDPTGKAMSANATFTAKLAETEAKLKEVPDLAGVAP